MTQVKFVKRDDNYVGILCEGHTGFAEYGKDIVCAAISSIVGALKIGVNSVVKVNARVVQDDDKGYMEIRIPANISPDKLRDVQVLFSTAHIALLDLAEQYPSSINVEVNLCY